MDGVEAYFITLRDGERVRVARAGPTDAPAVVLVHGWACSIYSWRNQLPVLAAAGFRAVAVELRGHGLSAHPIDGERYTASAMTSFLEEVLDALGLGRVAFVAHSLGAGIAARVALRQPERVVRLAAISGIGFGGTTVIAPLARLPDWLVRPLLPVGSTRTMFRLVLRMVVGRARRYGARDVDEYWAATQFPAFMLVLWRLVQRFAWDELTPGERARLTVGARVPLLRVYGARDRLVRRPTAWDHGQARWSGSVPAAAGAGHEHDTEVVLEGVGHAAHEEVPQEVNRLLLSFLAPWLTERDGDAHGAADRGVHRTEHDR